MDYVTKGLEPADALRYFDETDVEHIWAMCPDEAGIGLAVANRLNKAAGFHIVEA